MDIMDLLLRKITYMHIHKFDIKLQRVLDHSGPLGEGVSGEKFPGTPKGEMANSLLQKSFTVLG